MAQQVEQSSRESIILHKVDSFPVLPATVARVLEITSDPESSAQDLMKAIMLDQGMCITILKIANSALFGQQKKVSSIERAVVVLGFSEIQAIVLAKAVAGSFDDLTRANLSLMDDFWDHGFTCGLAAKIIGEHMNLSPGDLFVSGLIHDVGKLAMYLCFPEDYNADTWLNSFSTVEHLVDEKMRFSIDHCMVGRKLLEHWNFPQILLASVGQHHEPFRAGKDTCYPLVVQIADFFAHLYSHQVLLHDATLDELVDLHLPDLKMQWNECGFSWDSVVLESWFNWLKIDREYGSSVLSVLIS